jgi:hypothetical protein
MSNAQPVPLSPGHIELLRKALSRAVELTLDIDDEIHFTDGDREQRKQLVGRFLMMDEYLKVYQPKGEHNGTA